MDFNLFVYASQSSLRKSSSKLTSVVSILSSNVMPSISKSKSSSSSSLAFVVAGTYYCY